MMRIKILGISILIITLLSFSNRQELKSTIEIQWTSELQGDFSFINNWDYQEGIYRNEFGQLSCDGICPERTYNMKDKNGMILKDSLEIFYQLIDTTHLYHSIVSEVNMYEYSGTNYIEAQRMNDHSVKCFSIYNVSTHCSLVIDLANNTCNVTVDLNSITNIDRHTFQYKSGYITIDQDEWEKGVLKAKFDFTFDNDLEKSVPLNWKGLIYKKIENE